MLVGVVVRAADFGSFAQAGSQGEAELHRSDKSEQFNDQPAERQEA